MTRRKSMYVIALGVVLLAGIVALVWCRLCPCGEGAAEADRDSLALTRVVLYQNGVGYFERRGKLPSETLHLRVNPDQVNDVLKSLTIIDLTSARPSTVSLPVEKSGGRIEEELPAQVRRAGGLVAMLAALRGAHVKVKALGGDVAGRVVGVELPPLPGGEGPADTAPKARLTIMEDAGTLTMLALDRIEHVELRDRALQIGLGRSLDASLAAGKWKPVDLKIDVKGAKGHDVMVSYIHEVPTWKPAYRLWVEKGKQPLLQGWAAVHNVSGEAWKDVKLSLVAGTPLSFRYDLATPTYLLRPDLTPARPSMAAAPPPSDRGKAEEGKAQAPPSPAAAAPAPAPGAPVAPPEKKRAKMKDAVSQRGALGAFGKGGGAKATSALFGSLEEDGPAPETAAESPAPAAPPPPPPAESKPDMAAMQKSMQGALQGTTVGALFRYDVPDTVSVPEGSAALVSLVNAQVQGEDIHLFRPEAGQTMGTVPYRAVRVRNDSQSTLEAGPITLYVDGTFAGEGFIERTDPGVTVFVAYAMDPTVTLSLGTTSVEEAGKLVKIHSGQITVEIANTYRTTYKLENRLDKDIRVYVRKQRQAGYTVKAPPADLVTAGEAYFVPIDAPKSKTTELKFDEISPVSRMVAVDSDLAASAFKLYIEGGRASEKVAGPLKEVLAIREKIATIDRKIKDMSDKKRTLDESQTRVRSNLDALPRGPVAESLRKKLVAQLAEDEKQLATIAAETVKADVDKAELREKMMALVKDLTLEPDKKE